MAMSKSNVWLEPSPENRNTDKSGLVSMIVYPESAAEDWIDYLYDTQLKVAISPLHDSDLNKDGSFQKPHHHIVIKYSSSVSWYAYAEIRDKIQAYVNFEKVKSSEDIINYLTHDSYSSAGKVKYSKDDIQWLHCCELDFMTNEYIRVIQYIEDNHMYSLRSLIQSLLSTDDRINRKLVEWITKNTYFVQCYLKSFISRKKI